MLVFLASTRNKKWLDISNWKCTEVLNELLYTDIHKVLFLYDIWLNIQNKSKDITVMGLGSL
jgi:hypothetical protein